MGYPQKCPGQVKECNILVILNPLLFWRPSFKRKGIIVWTVLHSAVKVTENDFVVVFLLCFIICVKCRYDIHPIITFCCILIQQLYVPAEWLDEEMECLPAGSQRSKDRWLIERRWCIVSLEYFGSLLCVDKHNINSFIRDRRLSLASLHFISHFCCMISSFRTSVL